MVDFTRQPPKLHKTYRVKPDVWARFEVQCIEKGIPPSAAVGQLIEQAVKESEKNEHSKPGH